MSTRRPTTDLSIARAVATVKRIHAGGGRELTLDEARAFLCRPRAVWPAAPPEPRAPGRPRKTPPVRFRAAYWKLFGQPEAAERGTRARQGDGESLRARVFYAVIQLMTRDPPVPRRHWVRELMSLPNIGANERHVRRILRTLNVGSRNIRK